MLLPQLPIAGPGDNIPNPVGQSPVLDTSSVVVVATNNYNLNPQYRIINLTNEFSSYGYIYYASLYSGPSYVWMVIASLLVAVGLISNLVAFVTHIGAIFFTRQHMYKTVRSSSSISNRSSSSSSSVVVGSGDGASISSSSSILLGSNSDEHLVVSSPTPVIKRMSCLSRRLGCSTALVPALSCCWKYSLQTKCNHCPCRRYAAKRVGDINPRSPATTFPGVSIIKPLAGLDNNLETNLTSYFKLDYPQYEILFCVASEDDPVCDLVRRLQKLYSNTESRLLVVSETVGVNPKVNNLQGGYELSRYDLILISDSGVWMRSDTLSDMVATLTDNPRIGMVHQVPFMTPYSTTYNRCDATLQQHTLQQDQQQHNQNFRLYESQCSLNTTLPVKSGRDEHSPHRTYTQEAPSFTWVVQQVFFGCWHAKMYVSAALFGITCTSGMSCLLRKSVLQPCGGFKPFACYIAEDFFIAKYIKENGWLIKISHQPAWQNSPCHYLNQFMSRIVRWSQLRLTMAFLAYILEPLSRCLPNALLSAFAFSYFLPGLIDPGVYFLCYTLVWFLLDYILLCSIYPTWMPLCITKLEYLVAWCFWELTAVPFHFSSAFNRELLWRNRRFRIYWGGYSEQLFPKPDTRQKAGSVTAGQESLLTV